MGRYNEIAKRFGLPPANVAMGVDVADEADLEARVTFLESELCVSPETATETVSAGKDSEEGDVEPETAETSGTGDEESEK